MRHCAGDGLQARVRRGIQPGDGDHEALRVGMGELALCEDGARRRQLHHLSAVHDGDVVGHLRDDAEVMGDEQDGRAVLALEVVHQLEDLRLNRDVQRGGRLVGDEQLRLAGQRHGDHHALAHAAGELVRILPGDDLRVGDLHVGEHLDDLLPGLLLGEALVDDKRLGDLPLDGEHRVQAGHRLLEDDGDVVAADLLHLMDGQGRQLLAVELDATAFNVAVAVEQLEHAHGGNALAGAGLADDAERLAGLHLIGDAVDRLDHAALGGKEGLQVIHFKKRHALTSFTVQAPWDRARRAGRRRSG